MKIFGFEKELRIQKLLLESILEVAGGNLRRMLWLAAIYGYMSSNFKIPRQLRWWWAKG